MRIAGLSLIVALLCAAPAPAAAPAGTLQVHFFYSPTASVEPTYHTAIWIEDAAGKIVKTLFVSQQLSGGEYRAGNVCPDWVKQARWEAAPKSDVDAVTAPTPNTGESELTFDLSKLGLAPGPYGFRFQVHISENYNVLYRGAFTAGGPDAVVKIETVVGPGQPTTTDQLVRNVEVRYRAGS